MTYLLILFGLLLAVTTGLGYAQEQSLQHFDTRDGLPSSSVYMCLEDHQGYIWFATSEGVCRYDGHKFKTYTQADGLPNNDVYWIQEDKFGRIWTRTMGPGGTFIQGDSVHTMGFPLIRDRYFSEFVQDSRGTWWLRGNKGTVSWDGSEFEDTWNNGLESLPDFMFTDKEGQDWFLFEDKVLVRKGLEYQIVHELDSIRGWCIVSENGTCIIEDYIFNLHYFDPTDNVFCSLDPDSFFEGRTQVSHGSGYGIFTFGSYVFYSLSGNFLLDGSLQPRSVPEIVQRADARWAFPDSQGNVWYCTVDQGVWMSPARTKFIEHVTVEDGITHANVTALASAQGGALFLGMENGDVNLLSKGGKVEAIKTPGARKVSFVLQRPNSQYLVGSYGGLTVLDASGEDRGLALSNQAIKFAGWPENSHLKENEIPGLGALKCGLSMNDTLFLTLQFNSIRKVWLSPDGTWYFSVLDEANGFALAHGPEGTIYQGTVMGLNHRQGPDFKEVEALEEMNGKYIRSLANGPGELLWIGTDGEGAFVYDQNRFWEIPESKGESIAQIVVDSIRNEVWFATGHGAWRLHWSQSNKGVYEVSVIDGTAGLRSEVVNAILPGDSAVYLATTNGLSVVGRKYWDQEASEPRVYINEVRVEGISLGLAEKYELSFDENDIEIGFVGLSYVEPGAQKYVYRLKGIDRDWRETSEPKVNYPQLQAGRYQFEVRLLYPGRKKGTVVAKIFFEIFPHWANTWWFRIGGALGLAALFGLALRVRLNVVRRREKLVYTHSQQILELEARALSAQMNPHFIFNSLNAIQYLMNLGEKDKGNIYLADFGKLIRLNLEAAESHEVSLEMEIERLEYYLKLELLRLPNLLSYQIKVNPGVDATGLKVPNMILQPFVENSIWHGILPSGRPGKVSIEVSREGRELLICIEDDGIGIEKSRLRKRDGHTSKGIDLVRRRLELNQNSGQPGSLEIRERRTASGTSLGTKVSIRLANK